VDNGVYTQYRTKDTLEGLGSTKAVIKQCLAAFPWMWNQDVTSDFHHDRFFLRFHFHLLRLGIDDDPRIKEVLSKVQSFFSKGHLSISNQNPHHTMIVTITILEYACRFLASSPGSTLVKALDEAYSRYKQSGTHEVVESQFPGSPNEYTSLQFTEFILQRRL